MIFSKIKHLKPNVSGTTRLLINAILFFYIISIPSITMAGTENLLKDDNPEAPWHITADEFNYDNTIEQYIARGNVILLKGERKLSADYVRFDNIKMKALARGNVILTAGDDIVTGSTMDLDLENETGVIDDGTIFIEKKHFYIKGGRFLKTGPDVYSAEKAEITSCDGDSPDWKITGRNLDITIEGYGSIKHAALWAKNVPVIYTPYFIFPAKRKRQTGFLFPEFGSSTRKGVDIEQPFFWAINDKSDATFYERYMEKRGFMQGLEYRYVMDEESKGTMMFNYLHDKKTDTGGESSADWGYEGDDYLRPNADRYWFRMKANQKLPAGFKAKLDIDIVSDQDYLTEFKDGYTGFTKSSDYYIDHFGRAIDDYDETERLNRLNISKTWTKYTFNGDIRWYDKIVKADDGEKNTTLQQLPDLQFDGVKQQLLDLPVYFTLDSQYTYFYRPDEDIYNDAEDKKNLIRGQRVDIHPRFYLPLRYGNYFTLEPSVGMRETLWYTEKNTDDVFEEDGFMHREMVDFKVDLSTQVSSIYDLGPGGIDKIKHTIKPQVVYEYTPHVGQDEFPYFDSIDSISEKNLVTYSLVNTFTARSKLKAKSSAKGLQLPSEYIYTQMLWVKLSQGYDIERERSDLSEPFTDFKAEFEANALEYLTFFGDTRWSPYDNKFNTGNIAASLKDTRGDSITTEYRYTGDNVYDEDDDELLTAGESIYAAAKLRINKLLVLYGIYEHSLREGKTIKSGIGFVYEASCWSVDVSYTEEEDDNKIAFLINLYGLGQAGNK